MSFGGVASQDVRFTSGSTSVTAVTPRHNAGPVDITVSNDYYKITATAPNAFTYTSRFDSGTVEAILIPTPLVPETAPLAGANGSRWASELYLRNGSPIPVSAFLGDRQCLVCDPPSPPPDARPAEVAPFTGDPSLPGHMLYVRKSEVDSFAFSLRVRDLSRVAQNDGTELPVVRASRLTKRPIQILNVPLNSSSRAALRLFETDFETIIDPVAYVTLTSITDPQVSVFVRVPLSRAEGSGYDGILRAPGYATINDLKNDLSLPDGRYRVEIVPQSYDGWAFVAVTNNDTQLVTAITPN